MPHKFNAARRRKFDKAQYRVIHWAEYNESLRRRGDLTIWVSEEAQSVWRAPRRTSWGGQRRYSDLAIETCLTLRTAYRLGLRQTQGLMGSNRSGSPYCPDPPQWPHGLAGGHRVQPAQPDRNADRPLEERHRPQAQIPQLLQANHGDQGRPESSEHNDRTRTACVRTYRLTLRLGKGRIPSPPRSMQQRFDGCVAAHR